MDQRAKHPVCPHFAEVEHESPRADPSGLFVCARLVSITEPFDAGTTVELKFDMSPCHGLLGGELLMRIPVETARLYYVGDDVSIRIRLI